MASRVQMGSPTEAHDLWPFTAVFPLRDAQGETYEQTISVSSMPVACARGLGELEDFGPGVGELCMLIVQVSGSDPAPIVADREGLLRFVIGLQQRLVADIGAARAREIVASVNSYELFTRGGPQ